ncbi:MAG: L-threonylcarbamoyladenylate synthase, partial [Muribaculaceae bacterium]
KGGVILYPTDTIWGIGCDATNADAVKRVYEIKRRADNKAMLVLMDSANNLERYVTEVPEMAYQLIDVSDKPLTIIYDNAYNLAPNLLGDNNSVGIRISQEEFSNKLCHEFRKPIVSTSANISGEPSATKFSEISEDIKKEVDYIVKYRQNDEESHVASSIIMLSSDGTIKILRS